MTKKPPNPRGRAGDKLKIDLPFEDAVRAALEAKPPPRPPKSRRNKKQSPGKS